MRHAQRIIAFLLFLAIVLSVSLFSSFAVSSDSPTPYASVISDWVPWQPYKSDFLSPAGSDSIVFDLARNDGVYRRVVLPSGAFDVNCHVFWDYVVIEYNAKGSQAGCYMYYGDNFVSYEYISRPKDIADGDFHYTAQIDLKTYGIVCNSNSVNFIDEWNLHIIKPFPDEQLIEEQKTQGMISQLAQSIKDWFGNLIDSMGNFFKNLADTIGGYFTKLWNKIWWGNENGESEYDPPDVGSKFDDVVTSLNDWLSQLKDFSDTIKNQGDDVAGYISTGSNAFTKFLSYAPAPVLIFLTFGIIFVVVRKVVGR